MKVKKPLFLLTLFLSFGLTIYLNSSSLLRYFDSIKMNRCKNINDQLEKLNCYKSVVGSTVSRGDVDYAVVEYRNLIKEKLNDDGCHLIGHEIGREVYLSLKKDKKVKINDAMSECGYGFWHGLISGFSKQIINHDVSKDDVNGLCKSILSSDLDLSLCYHGLGLGFAGDPPRVDLWGNPKKIIVEGTKLCGILAVSDSYVYECNSGVFHQVFTYMKNDNYKLNLPTGDNLFKFCKDFDKNYHKACVDMLAPYFSRVAKTIPELGDIFANKLRWLENNSRKDAYTNTVSAIVDSQRWSGKKSIDISECSKVDIFYRQSCLDGFFWSERNSNGQ